MEGSNVKKFIIGWMTSKPEMQERFLAAIRAVLAATRQEKGCVFIEINLDLDSPNRAVVAECFESQEAHDIHSKMSHMATFREEMSRILVEARFENILSNNVTVDVPKYG